MCDIIGLSTKNRIICLRKEVESMLKTLTNRDIEDGKKISELFATLSEENKTMAIVYLSALRDKEIADSGKKKELQEV